MQWIANANAIVSEETVVETEGWSRMFPFPSLQVYLSTSFLRAPEVFRCPNVEALLLTGHAEMTGTRTLIVPVRLLPEPIPIAMPARRLALA